MTTIADARDVARRLNVAIDALNAALRRAEDGLRALALGVPASVPLPTGETLSWAKDGASWCLVVTSERGGWSPLLKARKAARIAAANELPALLEALIVSVDEQYREVTFARKAVERFEETISRPEVVLAFKRTP